MHNFFLWNTEVAMETLRAKMVNQMADSCFYYVEQLEEYAKNQNTLKVTWL